ncbi:Syntaxin 7 [Carabus blaptoides fortunei]
MLSIQKVKLHGMKSTKWDTQDKITQYRGLVSLYERDRKIIDADNKFVKRKLKQEISRLRKEIVEKRREYKNHVEGNRQNIRNVLSKHRDLQLVSQNMPLTKVVDVLEQRVFKKRKELDLIKYQTKLKTDQLVKIKLKQAELEDRIKYESKREIPEEETVQILQARIQDTILKIEAADEVGNTYKFIIDIMKKDAVYFDSVLAALQLDGYNQGKCILKITEMGQLAKEYLDDKKDEYVQLDLVVKQIRRERERAFKKIEDKLDYLHCNAKFLIRKDSFLELREPRKSIHSNSERELMNDIDGIEKTLNTLQKITLVARIEDIFPRIQEQAQQRTRLKELVTKHTEQRNRLMNKQNQAEAMYNTLCDTMVETTAWYKEEKTRSNTDIDEMRQKNTNTLDAIKDHARVVLSVRIFLQNLYEILRFVLAPNAKTIKDKKSKKSLAAGEVQIVKYDKSIKENTKKLVEIIKQKLNLLLKVRSTKTVDAMTKETIAQMFQEFVDEITEKNIMFPRVLKTDSFIEEIEMEDQQILSRAKIKAGSAEICKYHSINMDGFSSYHNNGNIREHDFNKLTQIGSSIQKISQNVSSIQRMVQQLGTSQDSRELQQQLEQIQQYTQQLAKDTSSNLKELNAVPMGLSPSEQRQFKMQRERLADEFATALNAFQATQRNAAQKVKEQIQRSKALTGGDPFAPAPRRGGDHQLIELQNSTGANSRHQQQQQMQDEMNLQLLEEQEQSIRRLEADISDVNQIFKELGAIVHEQGDLIDSIEASVERTEVFVSEGLLILTYWYV